MRSITLGSLTPPRAIAKISNVSAIIHWIPPMVELHDILCSRGYGYARATNVSAIIHWIPPMVKLHDILESDWWLGLRPGLRQDKAWNQARVRGRRFRHLGHRRVAELFGIMDMASRESWYSRTLPGLCILQLELGYGSC